MTTSGQSQSPVAQSQSSYPSSGGRRAPAGISAAQLRFLRQLCDRTPGAIDRSAVTRFSQDVADYDRATELERIGGRLVELPKADWARISAAAPSAN